MTCNIIRFTGDEIKFKSDKIPTKSIKKNITFNISNWYGKKKHTNKKKIIPPDKGVSFLVKKDLCDKYFLSIKTRVLDKI